MTRPSRVSESLLGKIAKVDPASGKVSAVIPLQGKRDAVVGDDTCGLLLPARTLTRIDASSNQTNTGRQRRDGPTGIAVGNGVVYVTNATDGSSARVGVKRIKGPRYYAAVSRVESDGVSFADGTMSVAVHAP